MVGWNVKIAAILGFLGLVGGAIKSMTDGDPATNPDWGTLFATGSALYALLFVRQANVTSETQASSGTKMQ